MLYRMRVVMVSKDIFKKSTITKNLADFDDWGVEKIKESIIRMI